MRQRETEPKSTESKRLSVQEAQANPEFWKLVQYRYSRIAKFTLYGNIITSKAASNLAQQILARYPKDLLNDNKNLVDKKNDSLVETKMNALLHIVQRLLREYFNSQVLFSTREEKEVSEKTPEKIQAEINDLLKKSLPDDLVDIDFTLPINELIKLQEKLKDLRKRWEKEIVSNRLTMAFLQEPLGDKYKEHAEKISAGKWGELDFTDPQFTDNLYKALRLKQISLRELSFADFLQDLYLDYQTKINQFSLFSGPLNSQYLKFMTKQEYEKFLSIMSSKGDEKSSIPPAISNESQYCYITMDFPRKVQVAFLYHALTTEENFIADKNTSRNRTEFLNGLLKYVMQVEYAKNKNPEPNILEHKRQIEELRKGNDRALDYFVLFIEENEEEILDYLQERLDPNSEESLSRNDIINLEILNRYAQLPFFGVYDNVDLSNSASPIFYRIVPTFTVMEKMNLVLGRKPFTPLPVMGNITPREMHRQEVNEAGEFFRTTGEFHSSVRIDNFPHDFKMRKTTFKDHDRSHHVAVSSLIPFPELARYVGNILKKEKKGSMSVALWNLTDRDFELDQFLEVKRSGNDHAYNNAVYDLIKINVLSPAKWDSDTKKCVQVENDWDCVDQFDQNILLMIDCIQHEEKWNEYISLALKPIEGMEPPLKKLMPMENSFYQNLKTFVKDEYPNHSAKFYIAAHRLTSGLKTQKEKKDMDMLSLLSKLEEQSVEVCIQPSEKVPYLIERYKQVKKKKLEKKDHEMPVKSTNVLDHLLMWDVNQGLYFKPELSFFNAPVKELAQSLSHENLHFAFITSLVSLIERREVKLEENMPYIEEKQRNPQISNYFHACLSNLEKMKKLKKLKKLDNNAIKNLFARIFQTASYHINSPGTLRDYFRNFSVHDLMLLEEQLNEFKTNDDCLQNLKIGLNDVNVMRQTINETYEGLLQKSLSDLKEYKLMDITNFRNSDIKKLLKNISFLLSKVNVLSEHTKDMFRSITPLLHYLVWLNDSALLESVMAKNLIADINVTWGTLNRTALHESADNPKGIVTTTMLIKNGANIHAKSLNDLTPIDIAHQKGTSDQILQCIYKETITQEQLDFVSHFAETLRAMTPKVNEIQDIFDSVQKELDKKNTTGFYFAVEVLKKFHAESKLENSPAKTILHYGLTQIEHCYADQFKFNLSPCPDIDDNLKTKLAAVNFPERKAVDATRVFVKK